MGSVQDKKLIVGLDIGTSKVVAIVVSCALPVCTNWAVWAMFSPRTSLGSTFSQTPAARSASSAR